MDSILPAPVVSKPTAASASSNSAVTKSTSATPMRSAPKIQYDIFISLRFIEAKAYGIALQQALEGLGFKVFLCNVEPGGDIATAIIDALSDCKLAVILGTETYGQKTGVGYSTFEELRFIFDRQKPFLLVEMCREFKEREALFRLTSDIAFYLWQPRSAAELPPVELVQKIAARVQQLRSTPAAVQSSAGPATASARPSLPDGHGAKPPAVAMTAAPVSLTAWLAKHRLDDLASVLINLEIETV